MVGGVFSWGFKQLDSRLIYCKFSVFVFSAEDID